MFFPTSDVLSDVAQFSARRHNDIMGGTQAVLIFNKRARHPEHLPCILLPSFELCKLIVVDVALTPFPRSSCSIYSPVTITWPSSP